MARVRIPVSFSYTSNPGGSTPTYVATTSGGSPTTSVDITEPVQNTTVTVTARGTGSPVTVFQTETGGATYTTLTTDASGNVPGWVNEGSYQIVAAAHGAFGGATYYFDAVRGDGVSNIATGAVGLSALITAIQQALTQPGVIEDYAGLTAPSGYVLCDGSVYATGSSGSTYFALSGVLGTRWNTGGEGVGNFRVPDLRGLVTVGAGAGSGLTSRAVGPRSTQTANAGVTGGEETHALSAAESGTNGGGTTTTESAAHYHASEHNAFVDYTGALEDVQGYIGTTPLTYGVNMQFNQTTTESSLHTHSLVARAADNVHNNMMPFAGVSKIIKL